MFGRVRVEKKREGPAPCYFFDNAWKSGCGGPARRKEPYVQACNGAKIIKLDPEGYEKRGWLRKLLDLPPKKSKQANKGPGETQAQA